MAKDTPADRLAERLDAADEARVAERATPQSEQVESLEEADVLAAQTARTLRARLIEVHERQRDQGRVMRRLGKIAGRKQLDIREGVDVPPQIAVDPHPDKGLQSPLVQVDGSSLPPADIHGHNIRRGWVFEVVKIDPHLYTPRGEPIDYSTGTVRIYEAAQDETTDERELSLMYEINPDEPFMFSLHHIRAQRKAEIFERHGLGDGASDIELAEVLREDEIFFQELFFSSEDNGFSHIRTFTDGQPDDYLQLAGRQEEAAAHATLLMNEALTQL